MKPTIERVLGNDLNKPDENIVRVIDSLNVFADSVQRIFDGHNGKRAD
jgi:hypothetical protein